MKYFSNLFKGIYKPLLFLPLALAVISITLMISTSYDDGIHLTDSTVLIQTAAYILGFIAIVVIANMDYQVFQDIEKKLYIGSLVFLLTVYIPGFGVELNGARSWINLGFTTFQPSEIVKITFILLLANYLKRHKNDLYSFKEVMKALLYSAPFIGVVLIQDLGSALVFIVVWIVMVFYAGIEASLFAKCAALVALCIPVAYQFLAPYQRQRIDAFLHPSNLNIGSNYNVWQSKIAIGSGGFWGKGLFNGTQKGLDFLPVRNSDFVFSVLIEELGFLGGAVLIAIYVWFIHTIMKVVHDCKETYGSFMVIGFVAMFTFQIFENIGMTMGIMPVTGITLPFISYGGSSVLANMIAVGLIVNVAIRNRGMKF
ncbi:MAG: rod shape-determining protein RodA [Eubacteriaceae bacterium]|nr:rod shape-determining protein RodA [Eubacteriaceae bacterium]